MHDDGIISARVTMPKGSSLAREISRRLPNAGILALLAILGIWGHRHHWRMPRLKDFTARSVAPQGVLPASPRAEAPSAAESVGDARASRAQTRESSGGMPEREGLPAPEPAVDDDASLPVIRFQSEEAVQKASIRVESAEVKEVEEFVIANGVVAYDETHLAQLAARAPGIAWRVDKKVGDAVRKAEVLAIVDSNDVGKAKAELLEAVVTFNLKAETLRHLERSRSSIPERTIREADAEAKLAYVRQFNARQTLNNFGLPVSPDWGNERSVEQLAREIQFLGIPEPIVAGFAGDVATANLIPLTAPFDGVVIDREIVTGEVVQTGHSQFVIADVSKIWLRLNVRKADAARLAIGQKICFSSDGLPREVESRLSWIATEVDEKTRTVQVRAEADNPIVESPDRGHDDGQRLLRAHAFGTARIRVRDERRTVVVPSSAIQAGAGRHLVFVPLPDGRSFRPQVVVLGVIRDDYTEVVRGIRAGDRVVTSGSYVLKAETGRAHGSPRRDDRLQSQ